MTDFIAYISAQQRMQAAMNDTDAMDIPRSGGACLLPRAGLRAIRQRVSVALYRLAEAIQPIGEPAGAFVNAPR